MSAEQAEVRRQQRLEELCAGTLRALTGDATLHFRGHRPWRGDRPLGLGAPHLRVDPATDDLASWRGASDGLALRLRHSDPALHARLSPEGTVARFVFELLEQYRCESLAVWPGLRQNLWQRHQAWTDAFLRSRLTESVSGLLLFTIAQSVRMRLTGDVMPEAVEDLMEGTRMGLATAIGHDLAALRGARHDQRRYAVHARAVAEHVAAQVDLAQLADAARGRAADGAEGTDGEAPAFALWLDGADDGEGPARDRAGSAGSAHADTAETYRVFTRAYDREQDAAEGIRPAQLRSWREQLDERIAAQGLSVARLARELRLHLSRPDTDGWDSGQDEGRIDGRRLAQLVANPDERRLFRRERVQPRAAAAVTLLLDCSGSMKVHAGPLAVLADVLMRALDLAELPGELLGFTTGAWNGGRAARDWQRAGSPPQPGRLNERLHLIFKAAETPWRRARPAIASLLRTDRYREGLDGEAVEWACGRLAARPAERRVLVVVSDGCPMDAATQRANGAAWLDRHLQQVIAQQAARGIEIVGLGVGLDLSGTYRHSRVIELDGAVRHRAFDDLLDLLAMRR